MRKFKLDASSARTMLYITSALGLLLIFLPLDELARVTGWRIINVLVASLAAVHGIVALRILFALERTRAGGTIPFATCFLGVQHIAFGGGGLLVAIFDNHYTYQNEQGRFSFEEAMVPLLLLHMAAVFAGLLGCALAVRSARQPSAHLRGTHLQWRYAQPFCLISLAFHFIFWVVLPRLHLEGVPGYAVLVLSPPMTSMFLLWGLAWRECTAKPLFLCYFAGFGLLQMLQGNRTYFTFPIVLFGAGLLLSGARSLPGGKTLMKLALVTPLILWAFVRSEDLRMVFARSSDTDSAQALERLQALSDPSTSSSSRDVADGSGVPMNSQFRIGSRLFEISAADVVSRTPSDVPFWGWTSEDTSVFLTGLLPLKLNPNAAFFASDSAGVFFLRRYGWYVDPLAENGSPTSMPATVVADSWRRFGWAGVVGIFFVFCWFLGKLTVRFRYSSTQLFRALFSAALLAELAFVYTSDATSLISSIPRRLVIMTIYAGTVWIVKELFWPSTQAAGRSPQVTNQPPVFARRVSLPDRPTQ